MELSPEYISNAVVTEYLSKGYHARDGVLTPRTESERFLERDPRSKYMRGVKRLFRPKTKAQQGSSDRDHARVLISARTAPNG